MRVYITIYTYILHIYIYIFTYSLIHSACVCACVPWLYACIPYIYVHTYTCIHELHIQFNISWVYVYARSLCWWRVGQAWLFWVKAVAIPHGLRTRPRPMAQKRTVATAILWRHYGHLVWVHLALFPLNIRKLHFGCFPDCVPTKPWHSSPLNKLFSWHRMKRRTLWLQELQKQWLLCRRWEGLRPTAWAAFPWSLWASCVCVRLLPQQPQLHHRNMWRARVLALVSFNCCRSLAAVPILWQCGWLSHVVT